MRSRFAGQTECRSRGRFVSNCRGTASLTQLAVLAALMSTVLTLAVTLLSSAGGAATSVGVCLTGVVSGEWTRCGGNGGGYHERAATDPGTLPAFADAHAVEATRESDLPIDWDATIQANIDPSSATPAEGNGWFASVTHELSGHGIVEQARAERSPQAGETAWTFDYEKLVRYVYEQMRTRNPLDAQRYEEIKDLHRMLAYPDTHSADLAPHTRDIVERAIPLVERLGFDAKPKKIEGLGWGISIEESMGYEECINQGLSDDFCTVMEVLAENRESSHPVGILISPALETGAHYDTSSGDFVFGPDQWDALLSGSRLAYDHERVHHLVRLGEIDYPAIAIIADVPPKLIPPAPRCDRNDGACKPVLRSYFYGAPVNGAPTTDNFPTDESFHPESYYSDEIEAFRRMATAYLRRLEQIARGLHEQDAYGGDQRLDWHLGPADVEYLDFGRSTAYIGLALAEAAIQTHANALQMIPTVPTRAAFGTNAPSFGVVMHFPEYRDEMRKRGSAVIYVEPEGTPFNVTLGIPRPGKRELKLTVPVPGDRNHGVFDGNPWDSWAVVQPIVTEILEEQLEVFSQDVQELRRLSDEIAVLEEYVYGRLSQLLGDADSL